LTKPLHFVKVRLDQNTGIARKREKPVATEEFIRKTGDRWKERITAILGPAPPITCTWHGVQDITSVLKGMSGELIGHLYFPDGGGNDLKDTRLSQEKRCIELHAGSINVVQPVKLTFHRIPQFLVEWSFFHLTTMRMPASGIYQTPSERVSYEPLTEYPDGSYDDIEYSESGYRDGPNGPVRIPDGSRKISRYIKPGVFVLVCKGSLYNIRQGRPVTGDTYDGRHNQMAEHQFLHLMQQYALVIP